MQENLKIKGSANPFSTGRNEEILGSGGYLGARQSIVRAKEQRRAVAAGTIILRPERPSKSELWSLD